MSKAVKITHNALVKQIAKKTNYAEYEVEDILHGLALVVQDSVNNNTKIHVKGIGVFGLRVSYPRVFKSNFENLDKVYSVQTKRGVTVKSDILMENAINNATKEQVNANTDKQPT